MTAPNLPFVRTSLADKRLALALEAAASLGVLALAVCIRAFSLGKTPRIVTGDELENVQTGYQIIAGTGPGLFGLDWNPGPVLTMYPMAWVLQVFGYSVADFRVYAVAFSVLALIAFYLLARVSMQAHAALLALALLATNLWFLNFSRTAWGNIHAAFFAVGACFTVTYALRSGGQRWWLWWAATGIFLALGWYGYFAGRLLIIGVALAAGLAVAARQAPLRRTAAGLVIAVLVGAAFFAPQIPSLTDSWHDSNSRVDTVSVFRGRSYFDRSAWSAARGNVVRNFKGFVLMDGSTMDRGLWARYGPEDHPPLDAVTMWLFWGGLAVSAFRWRKTYTWWPFFVPLAIVEIFTRGTPDLARALFFAPFYFLFIGMLFDELFSWLRTRQAAALAAAALAIALVAFTGQREVRAYFSWQGEPETQAARLPGVDRCEFGTWQQIARDAAALDVFIDGEAWEAKRQQLNCSPIIRQSNQPGGIFELDP
jgi:4-amino-4-deoxy-L-arabinose transferase-like glycosyltransferase